MKRAVLRIIDANLNRSREGLRVCEEIARFALNAPQLTRELKTVRHAVSSLAVGGGSAGGMTRLELLLESRDSRHDVARASQTRSEMTRHDIAALFMANSQRAKESLRVLEEFFKMIDRKHALHCSRLRFRVYDIEKDALTKIASLRDRR